jgi:hypothetical protein
MVLFSTFEQSSDHFYYLALQNCSICDYEETIMNDEACVLRVILLHVLIWAGPRDSGARQCAWTDDVDIDVEQFYQVK